MTVRRKEGTVTVNAKKIYEIIREVPNEQVQLKRLENDWVEIRTFATSPSTSPRTPTSRSVAVTAFGRAPLRFSADQSLKRNRIM